MSTYRVALAECGSAEHLRDVKDLQERCGGIPHHYSSWPLHSTVGLWRWCRVLDAGGALITGFAVHLTWSRALPGTYIGSIDYLGRALHEPIATSLGEVLCEAGRKIPRLLRLDARIFDENPTRRHEIAASLAAAGLVPREHCRRYRHTLWLEIGSSEADLLRRFSSRVRSAIRKVSTSPLLRFAPITDDRYEHRIAHLYGLPFARTGGQPPPLDLRAILRDSRGQSNSLLIGAFLPDRSMPEDLVGFAWARLHGDFAVLEINASQRSFPFCNSVSPGFGLVWRLLVWAMQHGARWMDLGGLPSTRTGPGDPMRGIIEFKTRFSSNFCEVAEEWQLEPHPLLASAAAATRQMAQLVRRTQSSLRSIAMGRPELIGPTQHFGQRFGKQQGQPQS
jgi:hypothetical protein